MLKSRIVTNALSLPSRDSQISPPIDPNIYIYNLLSPSITVVLICLKTENESSKEEGERNWNSGLEQGAGRGLGGTPEFVKLYWSLDFLCLTVLPLLPPSDDYFHLFTLAPLLKAILCILWLAKCTLHVWGNDLVILWLQL